jgi:flavin-dependent dehydrogenase
MKVDVAIIGGGYGGSTCAGLLKKYAPELAVAVFGREVFPMLNEGWVKGERDPLRPGINLETPDEGLIVHTNTELNRA